MDSDPVPSSASQSPDSLYSETSPQLLDHTDAFEYDYDDHEEHDGSVYETLVGDEDDRSSQASPAWGRWPQDSTFGGPGWTPLAAHGETRHASIISISPRGSVGGARRGSTPLSRLAHSSSNPTFLSVDQDSFLLGRRRSSAKSSVPSRRRSSVFSNGSMTDPLEEERLRNFASMSQLARRFSEMVEVMNPLEGQEYGREDVGMARELLSAWSPYSTDTDYSEVHTAPYIPTPGPPPAPAVVSNFPLFSDARQNYSLNTPEDLHHRLRSPGFGLSVDALPAPYTPPPPVEPVRQLRSRLRPDLSRTATGYTFPSVRSDLESAPLAIPRPVLRRAVSTPHLSPAVPVPTKSLTKQNQPTGSFPLARSQPLGLSRLRESTKPSAPAAESRRPSLVAERRMSMVALGSRRMPSPRKVSLTLAPPALLDVRRVSIESRRGSSPRKLSAGSELRKVSLDPSRKSSTASRKSSIVSLGEYGYLAAQITPKAPAAEEATPKPSGANGDSLRDRRNAPPAIVLPPYHFPARALVSPGATTATPRYNPLDSFFGRSTPALSSSGSTSIDPLSPSSDGLKSPFTPGTGMGRGILDRGRPVTSPQFVDSFPGRTQWPVKVQSVGSVSPEVVQMDSKTVHRSPSYRFPLQSDGLGLLPSPLEVGAVDPKVTRVTFEQVPLKSILVHRTTESIVSPPTRPQPQRATSHSSVSDTQLAGDIQAHLHSKRESRLEMAHKSHESLSKPPMARQSSFTRLFQRAKAQATSPSSLGFPSK
jgi:hypothetical protein